MRAHEVDDFVGAHSWLWFECLTGLARVADLPGSVLAFQIEGSPRPFPGCRDARLNLGDSGVVGDSDGVDGADLGNRLLRYRILVDLGKSVVRDGLVVVGERTTRCGAQSGNVTGRESVDVRADRRLDLSFR